MKDNTLLKNRGNELFKNKKDRIRIFEAPISRFGQQK